MLVIKMASIIAAVSLLLMGHKLIVLAEYNDTLENGKQNQS